MLLKPYIKRHLKKRIRSSWTHPKQILDKNNKKTTLKSLILCTNNYTHTTAPTVTTPHLVSNLVYDVEQLARKAGLLPEADGVGDPASFAADVEIFLEDSPVPLLHVLQGFLRPMPLVPLGLSLSFSHVFQPLPEIIKKHYNILKNPFCRT